jgi:hypothetical protein
MGGKCPKIKHIVVPYFKALWYMFLFFPFLYFQISCFCFSQKKKKNGDSNVKPSI